MSARDDKIRQTVAELDAHIAEVEASVAALKALLADDEIPAEQDDPGLPRDHAARGLHSPSHQTSQRLIRCWCN